MEVKSNFYTTSEIAEMLKLNVMTIYRYIKSGKLSAHKIGKEYRVSKVELEKFLKSTQTHG
jgi:putative resolvase